jgi:hypothetical protein
MGKLYLFKIWEKGADILFCKDKINWMAKSKNPISYLQRIALILTVTIVEKKIV